MRIRVISLADKTDRRESVTAQLDAFGLPFSFFDALDGEAGKRMFNMIDKRKHVLNTGRMLESGEVGCYASHLSVWQECVERDEPVCVLEDDCSLADFFPSALETASALIQQYGFIRLQTETRAKKKPVRSANEFMLNRYTKMAHSALAYVISPEVARSFIDQSRELEAPVDVFIKLFWEHGNTLYGLTPYAAHESLHSVNTCIGDRRRRVRDSATRIAKIATRASWFFRRAAFNRRPGRDEC